MTEEIKPIEIRTLAEADANRGLLAKMPDGQVGVIAHVQQRGYHHSVCLEWKTGDYYVTSRVYSFDKVGEKITEIYRSGGMHSKEPFGRNNLIVWRKGIWGVDGQDRITEDWKKNYEGGER